MATYVGQQVLAEHRTVSPLPSKLSKLLKIQSCNDADFYHFTHDFSEFLTNETNYLSVTVIHSLYNYFDTSDPWIIVSGKNDMIVTILSRVTNPQILKHQIDIEEVW